jgi:hypothetical protein
MNKQIKSLYETFKNTPKKLKIVCDWDEVVMAAEPYCLWLTLKEKGEQSDFPTFFKKFWSGDENNWWEMDYDDWGVGLRIKDWKKERWVASPIKNLYEIEANIPDDFYQQTSFLTIAEDLLRLIKENKVEELVFLSASGGESKKEIFRETFYKLVNKTVYNDSKRGEMVKNIRLRLMTEERKIDPWIKTKADWIKQNASDFDIFIDDNPNICNSLVGKWFCKECLDRQEKWYEENKGMSAIFIPCDNCKPMRTVISPHYPATAKIATGEQEGYYRDVLLVKNEVSDLKKEDFNNE